MEMMKFLSCKNCKTLTLNLMPPHEGTSSVSRYETERFHGEHPVPFAEFVSRYPHLNAQVIAQKYEEYASKFEAKQLLSFFERNRNSEWFKERYEPSLSLIEKERANAVYRRNYELFLEDLAAGEFHSLNLDLPSDSNSNVIENLDESAALEEGEDDCVEEGEDTSDLIADENFNQTQTKSRFQSKSAIGNFAFLKSPIETCLRTSQPWTTRQQLKSWPSGLILKTLHPLISRQHILNLLSGEDCVDYVVLGEPNTGKNYFRMGWIVLKGDLSAEEKSAHLNRLRSRLDGTLLEIPTEKSTELVRFELHVDMIHEGKESSFDCASLKAKTRLTLPISSHPGRMKKDLFQCRQLALHFDRLIGVDHGLRGACNLALHSNSKEEAEDEKKIQSASDEDVKRALDLYIVYLRRVHLFCYYETCVERFRSAEEMIKRCGVHHWRRPSVDPLVEEKYGSGFCHRIDTTVDMVLNGISRTKLGQIGGKDVEKEIETFVTTQFQKIDDSKFRCSVGDCPKMFKGEEFVRKHIRNKHADAVQLVVGDAPYLNNYLKDPFKISFGGLVHFPNIFPDRRRHNGYNSERGSSRDRGFRGRGSRGSGAYSSSVPFTGRGRGAYYVNRTTEPYGQQRTYEENRGGRGGGSRFHPYRGRFGSAASNEPDYFDPDAPRSRTTVNSSLNY